MKGPLALSVVLCSKARKNQMPFAKNQDRFHRSHVNKNGFPTQSAFHQQVLLMPPLIMRRGARHRARGFATVEPASGTFSLRHCYRMEELGPSDNTGSSPVVARTARRLLTSAIVGDLRAQPARSNRTLHLQVAMPLSKHSQPRFHRPGAGDGKMLSSTSFRRDRSQRKLVPNLIDSDTSCRKPVSTKAGDAIAEE